MRYQTREFNTLGGCSVVLRKVSAGHWETLGGTLMHRKMGSGWCTYRRMGPNLSSGVVQVVCPSTWTSDTRAHKTLSDAACCAYAWSQAEGTVVPDGSR